MEIIVKNHRPNVIICDEIFQDYRAKWKMEPNVRISDEILKFCARHSHQSRQKLQQSINVDAEGKSSKRRFAYFPSLTTLFKLKSVPFRKKVSEYSTPHYVHCTRRERSQYCVTYSNIWSCIFIKGCPKLQQNIQCRWTVINVLSMQISRPKIEERKKIK